MQEVRAIETSDAMVRKVKLSLFMACMFKFCMFFVPRRHFLFHFLRNIRRLVTLIDKNFNPFNHE